MSKNVYELIKENEWIIYDIISKYPKIHSKEDLYQAGVIGIIKANKKYKDTFNTKFSTYAYLYVKGEILDFIKKDRNIKLGSETLKIYKKYIKLVEILTQQLEKTPSIKEVAEYMNVDENTLENIIRVSEYELSLDKYKNEEQNINYYDTIEDKKQNIQLKVELESELEKLKPLERELIKYRYKNDYTQSETAKILNINQVQVSRYENKALQRIRSNMY